MAIEMEPVAGDWIILRSWGLSAREVVKVTPKMLKLGGGSQRYPSQIVRGKKDVVCVVPDRETAESLLNKIAGADGEYSRRRSAAQDDFNARSRSAAEARDAAVAKLVSAAISRATETEGE